MNGLLTYSYLESVLEQDAQFALEALRELERIQSQFKLKSTYTVASSVSALLNHWLVNRELKPCERGKPVDDVTTATVSLDRPEDGLAAIEDAWQISIVELMQLIQSKGMTFPMALCADASSTPEDDLPNAMGYTIRGAALALAEKYGMPFHAFRKSILDAAQQGKVKMRDPITGLPCDFDGRDFRQRIRIEDLNKWLEDSDVEYRLDEPAVPPLDESEAKAKEPPQTASWILLVQAEAAERWVKLRKSGCSPTKHNIKDDLVKWCAEKNIKTATKVAVSSENLYKFALRPWTPPDD